MGKKLYKSLLIILIIVQIVYTVYTFVYVKDGAHSDEVWSYGIANSYYGYTDAYSPDKQETWTPGEYFKNYITVQKGEQFAYGSVYSNSTGDMSPFLYPMLLHTVCSFFPDRFSWWFAFAPSLFFLAVTQVFLFLTARKITGSEAAAFAVCLFYGGGQGALTTFTFLRPYSLLTMLCVAFTYFSACCYETIQETGKMVTRHIVLTAVMACLAFMTHYYGIAYVGMFTAFFCMYLLCKRKFQPMLVYGVSMLLALGVFYLSYPTSFGSVTNFEAGGGLTRGGTTAFSPAVQIRILFCYLFRYNYGFEISWYPTAFWNITLPLVGAALVGAVMLAFPFRHEERFWNMMRELKNRGLGLLRYLKGANYIPVFAIGSCYVLMKKIVQGVDIFLMGRFAMRYISQTVPLFAMAAVIAAWVILTKIVKKERVAEGTLLVIICIVLIRVNLSTTFPFTFPWYGDADVNYFEADTRGKNVLVADKSAGNLVTDVASYMPYLYEADAICFTFANTMEDYVKSETYEPRRIDYAIVNADIFELSPQEKQAFYNRLPQDSEWKDEDSADMDMGGFQIYINSEYDYDRTKLILEMAGNAHYEVLGAIVGQRGNYYILQFE